MVKLFDVLKSEHQEVKELLNQIQETGDEEGNLFEEVRRKLELHMNGEEKYFYPEMGDYEELKELIIEAYEEHEAAQSVLRKLRWITFTDIGFKARIKVLKDLIEHHIEEEENEIFPAIEQIVSEDQLEKIEQDYMEYQNKKLGLR